MSRADIDKAAERELREIERRSIFALLAKPLPRWEFVVGKYLGLVMTIAVNLWAMAAPIGNTIVWNDAATSGRITVTRDGWAGDRYCREFQQDIMIDGRVQNAYGVACREPRRATTWRLPGCCGGLASGPSARR